MLLPLTKERRLQVCANAIFNATDGQIQKGQSQNDVRGIMRRVSSLSHESIAR